MTRIMCLSDTHGSLPDLDLQGIDLVLFAGDFSFRPCYMINQQLKDYNKLFTPWVTRILKKCQFFWISGDQDDFTEILQRHEWANAISYLNINDSLVEFKGLKIYGFPWKQNWYNCAFRADDTPEGIGAKAASITDGTDVILSHGPVYGINDYIDSNYNHCGSKQLLQRVKQIKPRVVISGHLTNRKNKNIIIQDGIMYVGCAYEPTVIEL
jgi:Icc-related predicted phosphoesterase